MARSHLNEHTLRIRKRLVIPKAKLSSGMIVEARYRPQEGEAKRYMLLILNPRFYNQVHALTLDNFGFQIFDRFAKNQGLRYIPQYQQYRGLDIAEMVIEGSPKGFYAKRLRGGLDSYFNRAYRTMDLNSFGSINIIDYKFNKDTEATLMGTSVEEE